VTLVLGVVCVALLCCCAVLAWRLALLRQSLDLARRRIEVLEQDLDAALRPGPPTSSAERAVRRVIRTASRVREHGIGGMVQTTIDDLASWASNERADILNMAAADGTLTLFFSDIEGSTELNERLGDKVWLKVLVAHDRVVRTRVEQQRGQVVKSAGDGFMVAFRDAEAACRAALAIQRDLRRPRADSGVLRKHRVQVRIGIHTGQVVARDGDYFGRNVAMAARVADLAHGGDTYVSEPVADLLDGTDIEVEPVATYELKGLVGEHPVSRLVEPS